jgi:outer membrane cobalamin receptor
MVEVLGARIGSLTGADGRYEIRAVPAGSHVVRARGVGARSITREIILPDSGIVTADFSLQALPVALADIVVTPGRAAVSQDRVISSATLSTEDIADLPQLGEDIYRAITRLPGMATTEYSARFWVRGGPERELLARFDGVDLVEPFHLKDFDGALSIVDAATIGRLDLTTGGVTSEYGDRLTGVLAMETLRAPPGRAQHSLGLSLSNVRASSTGSYAGGKGEWLVAARRGYLEIMLELVGNDTELSPRYYDVSARTEYRLGDRHRLSLHLLQAGDAVDFTDEFGRILRSSYGSTFVWSGWRAQFSPRLSAHTVLSLTRLRWNRHGDARSIPASYLIDDVRSARTAGIRQDWALALRERLLLKWGFDLKAHSARYRYDSERRFGGDLHTALEPDGRSVGGYLAARARPVTPLTLEAGARFDRHSHTGDKILSPRFNTALELAPGTTLRAAWGKYDQAPGIHELQVQDAEQEFRPTEQAEQRAVGLERVLPSGIILKLEGYDRRYTRLNPVYLNLSNGTAVFPEAEFDRRVLLRRGGRARGIELLVQRREGRRFDWAGSYAYATAEDEIDGVVGTIPRARDQRHTVYLDFSYAPSPKWRLSWAWQFHSGWPYTERSIDTLPDGSQDIGPFQDVNAARLPSYHRLDARVTRRIPLGRNALRVFVDLFNLYDRKNPRGYEYVAEEIDGVFKVRRVPDNQLPFLPSLGVSFDF